MTTTNKLTRRIALIVNTPHATNYCYECGNTGVLIDHITQWEEVTEEEYKALKAYTSVNNMCVLEMVPDQRKVVEKSVQYHLNLIEKNKREEAERKRIAEEAKQRRLAKKLEREGKNKMEQLKLLSKELGVPLAVQVKG